MKSIDIELKKKQILNDVVSKMNVLARTMETDEALKALAGYIATPDNNDTKPIIARAMTEGFDKVKTVCQRFLVYGRTTDDNRLERMVDEELVVSDMFNLGSERTEAVLRYAYSSGRKYVISIIADNSTDAVVELSTLDEQRIYNGTVTSGLCEKVEWTPSKNENVICISGTGTFVIKVRTDADVSMQLSLSMPDSFNVGMTSTIKSCAHHIIVANILVEFLRDQWEKAAINYKADIDEQERILLSALNATIPFERRSQDWS